MTLAVRIAAALTQDTARPLVTWYDDASGERVELSAATFGNWVAKTANLLREDLDVQPGDRIAVALPRHWQTPVVQVAAWLADATVVAVPPGGSVPAAAAAFVAERDLDAAAVPRGVEVVALSLRPMGAGLAAPRPGVVDYATEVRAHGDAFVPAAAVAAPAAVVGADDVSAETLLAAVDSCNLAVGQRALVRHDPWTLDGLVTIGLAPLLLGAGVVLCADASAVPPSRLDTERVTLTLG